MKYYVFYNEDEEFAHVICVEQEINNPYLTEFDSEDEAWDYAEALPVAVVTDDIPYDLNML